MRLIVWLLAAFTLSWLGEVVQAQSPGFLAKDGQSLFPLGFYEFPKDGIAAKAMAEAGVNLVRVNGREDLDRAQRLGLFGVLPVAIQNGATGELEKQVLSVRDHPALAVWEGPDEVVWNFTAASALHRTMGVYPTTDEWKRQTPLAIEYSENKATEILPKMREGIELIRNLDDRRRPFWINEAQGSDVRFVREYLDWIDITGCDTYPIRATQSNLPRIAFATERWRTIGCGKPVWMVLQGFSWHELGDYYGHKEPAYPTFPESRFMAYSSLVHGASGILYWGSDFTQSLPFRQSLYALVSELAALQPFLAAPNSVQSKVETIPSDDDETTKGIHSLVRHAGEDWIVAVVNEDDQRHMGVVVSGLESLEGNPLLLLYGDESAKVRGGEMVIRLQPYEVKVYCTSRRFETQRREGREFGR